MPLLGLPGPGARSSDPVVRSAVRTALSVSVATGLYGVSFGALSVAAGLDLPQTMVLSLLMFSGGSQFAAVGVLGAGGGVGAVVATAGLLGARNGLYGVQVAPLLGARGWRRLLAAHLTIDESTAVATAQPSPAATRAGFWWTGAGVFLLWNAFTLAGALLGDALGDPRRYGLDAAAGAAFLALLWPRLSGAGTGTVRVVAVAAAATALALTPVVPAGVPVLAAAALAVVVGVLERPDGDPEPPGAEAAAGPVVTPGPAGAAS
ncbi:putative branched-subunit amino acid permease [Cellulomonas hominis]|uniref:Putative branched-subunit amino acid permease n=1 Tax=Cellulomonas hominis TaxID=156981 RepID=A0A7W8SG24_9CELL|nr:AzlC family ABC transporter permease [Cellulomonas hominis]MBB5474358.1 putative branched-subunit amino acid permease [Cellulomonas hominis]